MPNPPLANMLLVTPVEDSAADAGDWDRILNDALELVDAHDHTSGKGARVPPGGLNLNADVSFTNSPGLVGVGRLDFTPVAALSAGGAVLWANSSDGNELYWRTQGGTNVKLTSGSGLNVSLVGGIGGDYSSIGAELAYVDADDRYTHKQQLDTAVRQWAKIAGADLHLYEYKAAGDVTTISNHVRLKSPAALAGSYDVTMPAALPGSQVAVQMTSAGVLTPSNTFPVLITASAGVTAAAGQHMIVSGAGRHKHGDMIRSQVGYLVLSTNPAAASAFSVANNWWGTTTGAGSMHFMIGPFFVGEQLKSFTFRMAGDGAVDVTDYHVSKWSAAGVETNIGSGSQTNVGAEADYTVNVTDTVVADGDTFSFQISYNAAGLNIRAGFRSTLDFP